MQNPITCNQSIELTSMKSMNISINQSNQEIDNSNCITLPKVKCAFHPHQTITNFCTCQCCLLPLCPSCIKIHTIQHINMKKVNPQYQPITDLLQQIYGQVQELLTSTNENYKNILDIDSHVGAFRTTIQQKVVSVKQGILNQVQKYFAKLDEDIQKKIENMNYIKMLRQYKNETKKTIVGLKNIQRCFNPENDKIMRIVIKYKGGDIKKEIQQFQNGLSEFLKQVNHNFVTFSVREDYKQIINNYLDNVKKIQVCDIRSLQNIQNLHIKLTEVYQKTTQQNKKQIKKSIGSFLANSASKQRQNQQNIEKSICEVKSNYKTLISYTNTPIKDNHNRRSISKGKGLSLMQINNTFNTSCFGQNKGPRAINICTPIQFNKTTIIRKDR